MTNPVLSPVLNREQSRELDRRATEQFGIPSVVLMENAGRGLADFLQSQGVGPSTAGHVAICCGRGNNAGDGFVLARHLDLRGVPVRVLVWGDPNELRGDAAINYRILAASGVPLEVFAAGHDAARLARLLEGAAWIVDALLGTGARGEPRPPLDAVIRQLNEHPAPKLAVDLPSGLDCDTGAASATTIRAAHTCTFVALKPGFLVPQAQPFVGETHVLDIGAPRKLLDTL